MKTNKKPVAAVAEIADRTAYSALIKVGGGGHFEIQYGGHRGQISGGPISKNICTILVSICAKFGAFITKCTIWSNIGT